MDWWPTIDVVVVGTDVDLLILLIHLSSSDNHLYLFKPGSGKYSNNVYTNHVQDTARGPGPARDPILSGPRDVPKLLYEPARGMP